MISLLISLAIAFAVAIGLHGSTRRFVRDRLRYVAAVQRALAPWVAGGAAFLVALPIAGLLPFVGLGTAVTAGVAVAAGVSNGVRDIRRGTTPVVYGP